MNNRTYQNSIQTTSNAQLLQRELIDEQAAVLPYQASYLHPSSAPGTPAPIYYSSPYSNPASTTLGVMPQSTPSSTTGLMMPMIPSVTTAKQPSMSTNSVSPNSSLLTSSSSINVPSTSTSLQTNLTNPKVINSSTNPFSSSWKANYVTITDTSQEAPNVPSLDPNAFSKLETQAFDWFKKEDKPSNTSPPKKLELETEKTPVSYLSEQMKNLDPWVTFESPTKSSPPSPFPTTSIATNNSTTTNPKVSDTKLTQPPPQFSKPSPVEALTRPAPPTATIIASAPVSKPVTTMTSPNFIPQSGMVTSVPGPITTSSSKPKVVKTQTVSNPAPMQIYTTIESSNASLTPKPTSQPKSQRAVSKAPSGPPSGSSNISSVAQPSKIQTQNYGVYGHIPSTTPQKSPKQPNIALMASDDAVNLLRQKYGLAPTKKVTETSTTTSNSRPTAVSNGTEIDIFARKPNRSSLTDQKMIDAKAQILVNQFGNTITKEQASFVLSENNMDVKKAIKSIKVSPISI